ncbi:flagella basal body P-ring formation protein FlgA [Roseibacterium beibuensis]|uniref:flagella basal body P-ring formation protein FlgA n=1 Tax=[Roseibacterium] beibuensis TaxID=1193142 RepID=UPI00217F0650|nr:flagella basal body P-ring formation protein FlgA [Roseibacterium beibuensis]MCS6627612.1 flagella basal body P-ring formation protein FlgA [Roseibacterium beibuensis]
MIALIAAAAALLLAGPALAGPVTLKANPVDADGQVTLGDMFDGAGSASGVVVGVRSGPSAVFEAGQLQAMARQSGLDWANPTGLRRVVVRHAAVAPAPAAALASTDAPAAAVPVRAAPVRAGYADRIISRNDIVEVTWEAAGVRLTITGRAESNATEGQRFAIRNLQSDRIFDAVATAPGQAIAGPGAQAFRNQQFAAR